MPFYAFKRHLTPCFADSLDRPARGLALSQVSQIRATKDNQSKWDIFKEVENDLELRS